jgi:hypothetical protein
MIVAFLTSIDFGGLTLASPAGFVAFFDSVAASAGQAVIANPAARVVLADRKVRREMSVAVQGSADDAL